MKHGYVRLLLLITALGLLSGFAGKKPAADKSLSIIPWPAQMKTVDSEFVIQKDTCIASDPAFGEDAGIADYLIKRIETQTGLKLSLCDAQAAGDMSGSSIRLVHIDSDRKLGREGYRLESGNKLELKAAAPEGLFRGCQTVMQLMTRRGNSVVVPGVSIVDYPRFAHRGLLIDPARNFLSIDFLARMVDRMSEIKMNAMHLHLVDDQGWRLEIKRYPNLMKVGGAGGCYTQEQMRGLIEHAKSRYFTLIPEIDIPGHSTALIASYPELSCTGEAVEVSRKIGIHKNLLCPGNEEVYKFLDGLFEEVAALFPAAYIHIGSDEVPSGVWEKCPRCQALMKKQGLKTKEELQAYFVKRVNAILQKYGKTMLAWDETAEFAPEGIVVQAWRGMKYAKTATDLGHPVIVSPLQHWYLDYPQRLFGLKKAYSLDPLEGIAADKQGLILGGEACIWGEFATQEKIDSKIFPRLLAVSETLWTPQAGRDYRNFHARVDALEEWFKIQGIDTSSFHKAVWKK